jgi:sugar O-acyltransferase (sialic acid O-acetyltransferase NeuD family)
MTNIEEVMHIDNKIVIFGTKDLAELALFYFRNDWLYEPVAFCVDGEFLKESKFCGLPVIPLEEITKIHKPQETTFFLPITQKGMGNLRRKKLDQVTSMGYEVCNLISPRAVVYGRINGFNNFVFENNVIQPFVTVGDNNIFWSGNHIGHHSVIGDDNFFTSHVVLSGHCQVGNGCYFGVNSTIRDGVKVANKTLVGMGAIIGKDTQENGVYTNPNTKARENIESMSLL